ncbi:MAG: hypothetical protein IJH34_02430, partial [Romboutsia sp.]|nr:hypothetical protein [Romboutsia sp.]
IILSTRFPYKKLLLAIICYFDYCQEEAIFILFTQNFLYGLQMVTLKIQALYLMIALMKKNLTILQVNG